MNNSAIEKLAELESEVQGWGIYDDTSEQYAIKQAYINGYNKKEMEVGIEIKKALLKMAKKCRNDMELPLNNYLENVSKNIDEIIQSLKQLKNC